MTGTKDLERKMLSWYDQDKGEGVWQLWTCCRGCAEMRECHGKERDRVRCLECFLSDRTVVPFVELGLSTYHDRDSALALHAEGLEMLAQRKREADDTRRLNLESARAEQRNMLDERNRQIVNLVNDNGYSFEEIAEKFSLSVKTLKNIASRRGVLVQ